MQQAQAKTCLSNLVLRNQLKLAGHLARAPKRDPTRIVCFEPNNRYEIRRLPQGHQSVGYRHVNGWLQRIADQAVPMKFSAAADRERLDFMVQRRCEGRTPAFRF